MGQVTPCPHRKTIKHQTTSLLVYWWEMDGNGGKARLVSWEWEILNAHLLVRQHCNLRLKNWSLNHKGMVFTDLVCRYDLLFVWTEMFESISSKHVPGSCKLLCTEFRETPKAYLPSGLGLSSLVVSQWRCRKSYHSFEFWRFGFTSVHSLMQSGLRNTLLIVVASSIDKYSLHDVGPWKSTHKH